MVDGDAIEPGAEICFASKARESVDCFEEDFLGCVFNVGTAMEHASRKIEEPQGVVDEQWLELIAII
jgi:hypothetical protein